jgi:hypothetical protein
MNCLFGLSTWCSEPAAPSTMAQKVRKPMLYPLSYEGLLCVFAQHDGRVLSIKIGLAASLPTVCAAPVPRAARRRLTTALTRGADCTAGGVELRAEAAE